MLPFSLSVVDSLRAPHTPLPLSADVLHCILLSSAPSPLPLALILFLSYEEKQQLFSTFPSPKFQPQQRLAVTRDFPFWKELAQLLVHPNSSHRICWARDVEAQKSS